MSNADTQFPQTFAVHLVGSHWVWFKGSITVLEISEAALITMSFYISATYNYNLAQERVEKSDFKKKKAKKVKIHSWISAAALS